MYDAIIVGARCAGSPLAMLLARRGHKVLLLDKAAFPSDTISTHHIHHVLEKTTTESDATITSNATAACAAADTIGPRNAGKV